MRYALSMAEHPTITDALELLDRAHQLARQTIAQAPSPQQALEWAAAYAKAADMIRRKAFGLRGDTAAEIWRSEEFDIALADVAEPYGVTEQRAWQIIREAKGES
jgi:hypothetical protein